MCGIVGYIGAKDCVELLLSGLESLEYRGYDSAGIAVFDGEKINVRKEKGRLAGLREILAGNPVFGNQKKRQDPLRGLLDAETSGNDH